MAPLIKIRLVLNNSLEVFGIYDSGSNVSLINSRLLKLNDKRTRNSKKSNLRTINGVKRTRGIVSLTAKIFNVEKEINVFVIDKETFDYDFLVGLDCIRSFYLSQDENLIISQKIPKTDTIPKEIRLINQEDNKISIERNIENSQSEYNISKDINSEHSQNEIISEKLIIKNSENEIICKEIIKENLEDNFFSEKMKDINPIQKIITENRYLVNFNEHIETESFDICVNHLDYDRRSKIDKLIQDNTSVFAKDKYDVGTVNDYEAHIDLLVEKYCSKRPYRCTIEDRKEIEKQVAMLLDKKLIEESYSPFAAPVTLAYKRDEKKKQDCALIFVI